ncbi:MAG: DUF4384 domain-containing protein [Zoogloeaceae bacterium]|jgi:hypothetical protein|nr:DUF4384 domain-containing protein [Zoogloeaceae bacterium]
MRRLSLLTTLAAALMMSGCITEQAVLRDAESAAEPIRSGPKDPVVKNITNFAPALRCMDRALMMYGIRDLVVISEDIADQTKKVSAGTKDMLISAVSDMTRSSRAIRLMAFGNDSVNFNSFMAQAEDKSLYRLRPQFGIRGSISQFDENIAKSTAGAGIAWNPFGSLGKASSASVSILGLDLAMVSADLTIIPGVTSNNTVAIVRSSSGTEAEAGYNKFGINFQMNMALSDGMSQALRNLVDLAAIELFGKLTKTPYWSCLGSTAEAPEVKIEIEDWYHSLFADPGSFVAYWQNQLRLRGLYNSEVNGIPDDALRFGVETYREALGLEKNAKIDLALFTAYLNANHYDIAPKVQALLAARQNNAPPQPQTQPIARVQQSAPTPLAAQTPPPAPAGNAPAPLRLDLRAASGSNRFRPGENIVFKVAPSRDAYVYCFMQDEHQTVMRFFPNRFSKDAFVPTRGVSVPKGSEFNINASTNGGQETVACFATERDVFTDLPANIAASDFEPLPVNGLAEVSAAFQRLRGVAAEFPIQLR